MLHRNFRGVHELVCDRVFKVKQRNLLAVNTTCNNEIPGKHFLFKPRDIKGEIVYFGRDLRRWTLHGIHELQTFS